MDEGMTEQVTEQIQEAESSMLAIMAVTSLAGLLSAVYLYKLLLSGPKKVFPLEEFQEFPLVRKDILSHDTRKFTFLLPSSNHVLGLPIGQHVSLSFTDKKTGKAVQRSYTPVESPHGEVCLVIKVYRPAPPKFPDGGLMSQHLDDLKIGETILMKGPKGHMNWFQSGKPGTFEVKPLGKPKQERYCEQIGMIAGGTGITPMLQILQEIFRTSRNYNVAVKMIYANQTEDDILVREELESMEREFPNFDLHYTVDNPPSEWKYSTGFINPKMVEEHLLFKDKSKPTQFFMCGPPPMLKFACIPALEAAGYTEKEWVSF
jgi:cytochrome-b5 reductase